MGSVKVVLIVEEDPKLQSLISGCLDSQLSLTLTQKSNKAFSIIEEKHFDLVILNTRYKNCNPFELCQRIKSETEAKVIFVSSSSSIDLKQLCFESGGDDYITMPFYPKELTLRINRLLNRYVPKSIVDIKEKGIQLNTQTKAIKVNSCTVWLSPTEFLIMEYLLKNDRPFNSDGITSYIESRKNKPVSNGSVTVGIKRLRCKLLKGTGMNVIKTRYGYGYYIGI